MDETNLKRELPQLSIEGYKDGQNKSSFRIAAYHTAIRNDLCEAIDNKDVPVILEPSYGFPNHATKKGQKKADIAVQSSTLGDTVIFFKAPTRSIQKNSSNLASTTLGEAVMLKDSNSNIEDILLINIVLSKSLNFAKDKRVKDIQNTLYMYTDHVYEPSRKYSSIRTVDILIDFQYPNDLIGATEIDVYDFHRKNLHLVQIYDASYLTVIQEIGKKYGK